MEPKVRDYLTQLRHDAFMEIKEGYVDSGAAPGKDVRWQEVAMLKPQTTTKEEVAARERKKLLWVVPISYTTRSKYITDSSQLGQPQDPKPVDPASTETPASTAAPAPTATPAKP
jgi:hypothetical protein